MSTQLLQRLMMACAAAAQVVLLSACATITGDPTQVVHIETLDEHGQPIGGMRCHLSNAASDYYGDSPLFGLEVHRSSSDLKISCRLGDRIAEGRAVSRSGARGGVTGAADLLLPGGSAYLVVDHLTGYRYAYPGWVQLKIGQKLVFDASDDVAGKPVPVARQEPAGPPPASRTQSVQQQPAAPRESAKPAPADLPPLSGRALVRTD